MEKEPELWLLKEFCEENYFTTLKQWLRWYEDGNEMAMCVLFEIDGKLYIDDKAWEKWLEESLICDGFSEKEAKEYVQGTYQHG